MVFQTFEKERLMEDRKFKFEDGQFINRVSGEPIPDDEPVIIFRARDTHSIDVLKYYRLLAKSPHHRKAIDDRIDEFTAYREANPQRMKEPGVTGNIVLNSPGPMERPSLLARLLGRVR